jgi:hypothetical protein
VNDIRVTTVEHGEEEWKFDVAIEGALTTCHRVSMRRLDYERLTGDTTKVGEMAGPEAFMEGTFRFLLHREPQGSILREFDITQIPRYFPEYEREMMKRYEDGR